MTRDNEFRKSSADAKEKADEAQTDDQKVSWLRIAQSWLTMVGGPRSAAERRFDDQLESDGTGQTDSKGSH